MTQLWSAANGYMATPTLSDELRHAVQPLVRFRSFCDVEEAIGKNAGEAFQWNTYGDTADEASTLDENAPMPETSFPISQGSVTMVEGGISIPYTGKFDDLSEHPVKNIIHKSLKANCRRFMDRQAHAQFDATPLTYVGTGASAYTVDDTGTLATNNNVELSFVHLKNMVDIAEERNIPVFDGEHYMLLARPSTLRPLTDDLESVHQYTSEGWRQIIAGERGRAAGARIFSQTNVAAETTNWASNGNQSDAAYLFGADTVTEAVAIPEEIRGKIPDDYGRGKGIAWYTINAFGITHADTTDANTRAQTRIMKWASAA